MFITFINDLLGTLKCQVKMFADDTKLSHRVTSKLDCEDLQKDINNLEKWAKTWQMNFHPEKCTLLRVGSNHPDHQYTMRNGTAIIRETPVEKDLGVHIDNKLKFSVHIENSVAKANRMLGLIHRSFVYLDEYTFVHLYKAKVRPILEYANNVCFPYLVRDRAILESVQRRATKLMPGLRDMSYEERLKHLKLQTLTYRRACGDMIQVCKYVTGKLTVNSNFHVSYTRSPVYSWS